MKILIDDRIVANWYRIPKVFRMKELLKVCDIPEKEEKVIYDNLERLRVLGLVHKSKERGWTKEYDKITTWFNKYISVIGSDVP
jgi:hypothetical protein